MRLLLLDVLARRNPIFFWFASHQIRLMTVIILRKFIYYFIFLAILLTTTVVKAQCPTISTTLQSFCDLESPTIANLTATNNGGGVVWYLTPTSTTPLSPSTGLINNQTYYADSSAGTCATRPSVNVKVYSAPTGLSFQGDCYDNPSQATVAMLDAIGNNVRWYLVPSGGTPLDPSTVLIDTTIYYASQTNPDTGCETSRLSVFVNNGFVPVPTGNPIQEFCLTPGNIPTIANLAASGSNNWYLTATSAVTLDFDTPLISGQSYFATTNDPPCESINRLEVLVILIEPHNAGISGTLEVCQNNVSNPINLFDHLGGTPETIGSWTGPLPTTAGYIGTIDPSTLTVSGSPYTFTYTVSSATCASATATVTINVLPLPVAAVSSNTIICSGDSATVTFSGTPNATVNYTVNAGAEQSILLNSSGIASFTDVYTSTTTIALVSVVSSNTTICTAPQNGNIVITVLPLPTVTLSSEQTICSGGSATVTFFGTPNATVQFTINGVPQTLILDASGVGTVTGNYTTTTTFTLSSISTTGSTSCSQTQTGSTIINVVPISVASISSDVQICPGQNATVTFNGTPNATVLYTVNSGALQTIVLSSNGTAIITQPYTATTTYTLVGVIAPGALVCPSPATGSTVITVLPLPIVALSGNSTICEGESATITFSGTPGATISYIVNGGVIQTITLDSFGNASTTNQYSTTTIIELVDATSPSVPACTVTQTGFITITVVALPVITLNDDITICEGEVAVVTFTGNPNAVVSYSIDGGAEQFITLNSSGTATLSNTYTETTVITLLDAITNGGQTCSQIQNDTIIITVIPAPVGTLSADTTICPNDSATVNFTGTPNATVSYTVNGGAVQTILLDSSGNASITENYAVTTIYTIVGITTNGTISCPVFASGTSTITIAPLPVVTITGNVTICEGESATVTFTGTPNATILYTVNGSATQTIVLDGSGSATASESYFVNTTISIVSATSAGTLSCTQPQAGTIVITVIEAPAASVSVQSPICVGENSTITFTGTPNSIVSYTIDNGSTQTIQIGSTGIATLVNSYTVSTTITLLSVSLAGTITCVTPLTQSIVIEVTQLPVVAITGTTSICSGETATITFTGTPGALVNYTINGVAATILLDASGLGTVTNAYTQNTTFELIDISGSEIPNCEAPASGSAIITIVPPPTVTISGAAVVCVGNSGTITFTGTPGAIITYTANGVLSTITLDASGNATFTGIFNSNTIFVLQSATLPGTSTCSQPQTGSAVVTVLSQPTASISSSTSVCSGSSAVVTFSGTPGATVGYTINGGANQTIVLNSSGIATISQTYTTTTLYTLLNVAITGPSGCSQALSGSMTVTVVQPPIATITLVTNQTICSGQTAVITFNGTPNATISYTVNNGTIQTILLNSSGTATLSPTVVNTSIYSLVSATTSGTPSCVAPQSGSVTITTTPVPNAGNDVANQAFCTNAGLQDLFLLLGSDADLGGVWSPVLSGGDGIFDPQVDTAGTYTYTVSGTAPCVNDIATITITLQTPPNAGSNATLNLCSNQDSVDLFPLLGPGADSNGTWSPVLTSGTSIFNPAVDAAGVYTYTVNGALPCGNSAAAVIISITNGPEAGQDGELVLCINSATQNLFDYLQGSPIIGGTWTPTLASGSGLFNPAIDAAGIYTYSFSGPNTCDNDSAVVNVVVNPIPDAGENGTAFFCTNYEPSDLFLTLNGIPQSGGVWTPSLASGNGIFNPLVDAPGTYTYTVGGGLCAIDFATVEVTVTQSPNAGGVGATLLITTCLTTNNIDLFTGLNGTQDAGTWSDDNNTGALNNNIFNPSLVGAGTYNFTYTVGGGVSPCLFDYATVTVVVDPLPNAGTFTSASAVCNSVGTFDLLTLLTGNQNDGIFTNATGQVVTNPINISTLAGGTYNFTYTIVNACGTDTEIIQVAILQNPVFTNANINITTSVCVGGAAIVSFSGLADGTYTINYSLTGSNTQNSQTVLLNVLAGVGTILIPASALPNAGNTQIVFNSVLNNASNCSATLSDVQLAFVVNPISNLNGATLQVINPCLGSPIIINVTTASGLPNGVYNFIYTIPGANTSVGTTADVTIQNGAGQIIIPGTIFTNAGVYSGTINAIISQNGCSNNAVSAPFAFEILPVPNPLGATVTANDICVGSDNTVFITGASNLVNGTYNITYELTGSVVATITHAVLFTDGETTFTIAGNQLNSAGNVTLTITQIALVGSACGADGAAFNQVVFNISNADVPTLTDLGNEFCRLDSPTIGALSLNIIGGQSVIWYNAAQGGTALSETDLLQNGVTYYASFVETTCSNSVRLSVTVDLTKCPDILIPDGFSPNDDGINDYFEIRNINELYPNYKIEIYNRYGAILYKGDRNVQNWDGRSSQGSVQLGDNVVPTGVYFFILEFNDGIRNPLQGRLYLSR